MDHRCALGQLSVQGRYHFVDLLERWFDDRCLVAHAHRPESDAHCLGDPHLVEVGRGRREERLAAIRQARHMDTADLGSLANFQRSAGAQIDAERELDEIAAVPNVGSPRFLFDRPLPLISNTFCHPVRELAP